MPSFNVALTQTCSGRNVHTNIEVVSNLIRQAVTDGAHLVCTPETTSLMAQDRKEFLDTVVPENRDPALAALRDLAKTKSIWLLIGSLSVRVTEHKAVNRSFLIAPDGNIKARYDKIHLFDVDLPNGEHHRESERYQAGDRVITAQLPWGILGMSICYDLRFPALYRGLAQRGASFLTVPSAFTHETGSVHWHVLLRARAIENGCFLFAPTQAGFHENGVRTYGHSLIVDPWGSILAEGGEDAGELVMARIDPEEVQKVRAHIPVLLHERRIDSLETSVLEAV